MSLLAGWFIYDGLCRTLVGKNDSWLALAVLILILAAAYGFTHVFSGRGALIHVGAFIGTMMAANVFAVIVPNQRKITVSLLKGESPDPRFGVIGKQRSLHNTYLTLPVLFLMLSNHYPLAFGTEFNWVIASLVFIIGVLIRHYFNTVHARKGNPTWTFVSENYKHPKYSKRNLPGYIGDDVGPFATSLHVDGGGAVTVPAYTNIQRQIFVDGIDWEFSNLDRYMQLHTSLYDKIAGVTTPGTFYQVGGLIHSVFPPLGRWNSATVRPRTAWMSRPEPSPA